MVGREALDRARICRRSGRRRAQGWEDSGKSASKVRRAASIPNAEGHANRTGVSAVLIESTVRAIRVVDACLLCEHRTKARRSQVRSRTPLGVLLSKSAAGASLRSVNPRRRRRCVDIRQLAYTSCRPEPTSAAGRHSRQHLIERVSKPAAWQFRGRGRDASTPVGLLEVVVSRYSTDPGEPGRSRLVRCWSTEVRRLVCDSVSAYLRYLRRWSRHRRSFRDVVARGT